MWENPELDLAIFHTNGWKLVVASGESPDGAIRILACRDGLVGASARIHLPGFAIPPCRESFVRGDALHLCFLETDAAPIGFDLVLMAIEADEGILVVETVVSLSTPLLDSHPMVEMEVGDGHPGHPRWTGGRWKRLLDGPDAMWVTALPSKSIDGPKVATSLLCDGRDLPSLAAEGEGDLRRIRFFGDFLEKGVIRRVQPWWIWSNGLITRRKADQLSAQLAQRPLALTN